MGRALVTIHTDADRQRAASWCRKAPAGTRIDFKGPRRNVEQSDAMWGKLTDIAQQVEWYGQKLSPTDWKEMATASLRKARVVPGIDPGTFVVLGMRTSDMSRAEMSDMLDFLTAFGMEHDVEFSDMKAEK